MQSSEQRAKACVEELNLDPHDAIGIERHIRAAVVAERERCAKLAERMMLRDDNCETTLATQITKTHNYACRDLARAIRTPAEQAEGSGDVSTVAE